VTDLELVLDAHANLGEGPAWDDTAGLLIWVDIPAGRVHRFDPSTGSDETFDVGQPVGAAVPTADGRLALAVSDGFALLDPETRALERIADVEAELPETQMNDGKCDPAGRFWAGTKDNDGRRPIGSLYRLDGDSTVDRIVTDVVISNGLGWSPDGRTMYYIDSKTYAVDAFDFDMGTGSASRRRRAIATPEPWGLPDGMTVDEEGFLWVAFWGGSAVRRFAPDGSVAAVIEFPVSQVTSCAFGGEELADLYVTSASGGLTPEERARQPHAGGLFRLRPGVRGLPARPYEMTG
jgi:sugar lactone lactonase YvrE